MKRFAAILIAFISAVAASASPVDIVQCAAMKAHHVLNAGAPVGCGRLAVVRFSYVDFGGRQHDDGAVVVLDAVAPSVERIFATLYDRRFPIAQALPMEAFDGDDDAAMAADNTSGFNHRVVVGSTRLSLHAYGVAIDINPVENPYLTFVGASVTVAPPQGAAFLNRREDRPNKPLRPGLAESVVEVFADNGFLEWGGDWDEPVDYQHFDIGRALAERLTSVSAEEARAVFAAAVHAYQDCIAQNADKLPAKRRQICAASRAP